MPTKLLANLETDVACTNSNMLGITDPKTDVTDIQTIRDQNAKVVCWNKIARWVAGNNSNEMQSHLTKRESL